MNSITLVGRMTRDPEAAGNSGAKFGLAVDDYNSQTKAKEAIFFDCVAFGRLAEVIQQYGEKGKQVAVQGKMKSRKYQNAQGQNVTSWSVYIDNFELLGGGSGAHPAQQNKTPAPALW